MHNELIATAAGAALPGACHCGAEIRKRADVRSGVMYPILWRMLEQGWLADGWEHADHARAQKRPPRRYYKLTSAGQTEMAALLREARGDTRFRSLFAAQAAREDASP